MDLTWLQQTPGTRDMRAARKVAEQLRAALDTAEVRGALTAIPAIGGTSHQVDAVVQPVAESLGFSSQSKTLFTEYPIALRPDWYRSLGTSGIILEVERGKTVTNNMDLLDLWKCHICREAHHLFIVVPNVVRRNYGTESVYPRVVTRLATFFAPGNETNVRSVAVFGYD
jgi:hypothetical protein